MSGFGGSENGHVGALGAVNMAALLNSFAHDYRPQFLNFGLNINLAAALAPIVPVQPLNTQDDMWTVYYNFDQYLWNPGNDPTRGIGIFFCFGASDGQASPIKYTSNVGVSGNGIVPGRPDDAFGVGWSWIDFSDKLIPFLRATLDLGLDHEDAVELHYDLAVTRWLGLTVDLQIVNPGLQKRLKSDGRLKDMNTAVVGGLRAFARF